MKSLRSSNELRQLKEILRPSHTPTQNPMRFTHTTMLKRGQQQQYDFRNKVSKRVTEDLNSQKMRQSTNFASQGEADSYALRQSTGAAVANPLLVQATQKRSSKARQLHSMSRLNNQKREIDDILWQLTAGSAGFAKMADTARASTRRDDNEDLMELVSEVDRVALDHIIDDSVAGAPSTLSIQLDGASLTKQRPRGDPMSRTYTKQQRA